MKSQRFASRRVVRLSRLSRPLFWLPFLLASTAARAQLTEVENAGTWVLAIFSPAILLIGLTVLLIGCGLAVWFGRMTGGLFVKILLGSLLVFGARTIAPQLVAAFA